MVSLPKQVHSNLLRMQQQTNLLPKDGDEDGLQIGEIRMDQNQATLIMHKSCDLGQKRWALNLDVQPLKTKSLGLVAETKQGMKLTSLFDAKITCVAKHYKVDEKQKEAFMTDNQRKQTLEIEAPTLD